MAALISFVWRLLLALHRSFLGEGRGQAQCSLAPWFYIILYLCLYVCDFTHLKNFICMHALCRSRRRPPRSGHKIWTASRDASKCKGHRAAGRCLPGHPLCKASHWLLEILLASTAWAMGWRERCYHVPSGVREMQLDPLGCTGEIKTSREECLRGGAGNHKHVLIITFC